MKIKSLLIAVSLLAAVPATAQNARDFAGYNRYAKENASLGQPRKGEKRVVFLGNSITEGWVAQRPDFFKSHGYIGRGISGQTSYQFLLRFRQDVLDLHPKVLVINAATNDIAENTGPYSEDITFGNIVTMAELAKAHKIKVILTSTLPARSFGWRPKITDGMKKIRSLNARLKAYAAKNKLQYVDYFSSMLAPDGQGLNPKFTPETVHPNAEGYKVMESLIVPAIEKAL